MKTSRFVLIVVVLFSVSIESVRAEFNYPRLVPLDRLVKSAEAYLVKHPDEADAHYTVARVHYLAFSAKQNQVAAFLSKNDDGTKPEVPPDWMKGSAIGINDPIM